MAALRTSLRRMPGSVLSSVSPRASAAPRHFTAPASLFAQHSSARLFSSTPRVRLEASAPLGDGGNTEPPEHGINVDKPLSMDTSVGFLLLSAVEDLELTDRFLVEPSTPSSFPFSPRPTPTTQPAGTADI